MFIYQLADKEMRDAKDFVWRLNVVSTQGKDEEKEKEEDKHENNQKFGLLEALIKVGAWTHAEKLLCQLPTYYLTAQPGISKQLCK